MKLQILNKKKNIIIAILATITIIILSIIIAIEGFKIYNMKEEVSTQPINQNDIVIEKTDEEEIDIESLEELSENIEENVIEDNKTNDNNKNKNNKANKQQNNDTATYYIKVNYEAQVVTIYKKDDNGDYTVPVKAMICSTGSATPTSGIYSIPAKYEWLRLQGNVYGHYSTQIKGNILFHSVPYLEKYNNASLEYWEYDKLGTYASAGCVRLTVSDAKWIYDNCSKGTKVEFYKNSNPGPLGKPSAKKISSYPEYLRNWDPTDPNSNNPWKTYKETNTNTTVNKNNETSKENNNKTNTTSTSITTVTNSISSNMNNTVSNNKTNTINNTMNKVTNNVINSTVKNTTNDSVRGTTNTLKGTTNNIN